MERTIELIWRCTSCGTKGILGRHKTCPQCGSPREEDEMAEMEVASESMDTLEMPSVTDPTLLALAQANPDWFCKSCGGGNHGGASECQGCGHKVDVAPSQPEPAQSGWEPDSNLPPNQSTETLSEYVWLITPASIGAFAISVCIALFSIALWVSQTHDATGVVSKMEWSQEVAVDAWVTYSTRNWRHLAHERQERKPLNGEGEIAGYELVPNSCVSRHYEDETYQCGTRMQSYDCSTHHMETYQGTCSKTESYVCGETCRSTGTGFKKCTPKRCTRTVDYSCSKKRSVRDPKTCNREIPKYCERPIYKDECSYWTQKWVQVKAPSLSGEGKEMSWPEIPALGPLERSRRSGKYVLTWSFVDNNEDHVFTKSVDRDSYLSWNIGQSVFLRVDRMGHVQQFSATPISE